MTFGELKAFIDGMDVQKQPTEKQWARLMEKLQQVESDQIMDILSGTTTPRVGSGTISPYQNPFGNIYAASVSSIDKPDMTVVKAGV